MRRGTAAIRVAGLHKAYGEVEAVGGIDFEVAEGECFALLGPNGAGKTTTVEILEGYRDRDAGEVEVLGHDPRRGQRELRERVGIVLQSSGHFRELSVREALDLFGGYYPHPRATGEVIDLVGLGEKAGARIKTLSGGQQRRLDLALGLVGDPDLLFLDEPTTGFDPQARREFWGLVTGLSAGGTTILLTTHYLHEAEALADRVAVISQGRILDIATPATLGDRDRQPATVRWQGEDGPQEVRTDAPTRTVTELAARHGGEVPGLSVTRPTLEDIYLSMIGADPAERAGSIRAGEA
jgi:ABC-2 type transport system ATP-binding protein